MPTHPASVAEYGLSVALDGGIAVIGYPGDDLLCPGTFFCRNGAVEVFERGATGWGAGAVLYPVDSSPSDEFGIAVDIDGSRILVGSRRDDDACGDVLCESGSAYVFERVNGSWRPGREARSERSCGR